jgi:ATP adenylyltransferase
MIVPNRHVDSIKQMTAAEKLDWLALTEEILDALRKALKPHGFNAGLNLGRAGGAGVPGHLHLHVVPRWDGDTNFMPVLSDTKVISESMESVYRALAKVLRVSQKPVRAGRRRP